jgi:Domain of unknown function (DUF4331)
MSSHREAPEISKDPVADSTDLYAFISPDRPDTTTLIANYLPLQNPAGGPNFYPFGDDVLYEIHVDNNGDGRADVTYQFQFTTRLRNDKTFLYNTGPIRSLDDPNWNSRQFYTVTKVDAWGHKKVIGRNLSCPPDNIGPLSTPNYASLAQAAVHTLDDGSKVFAGQRADGFYVDLGSIFDLLNLRPFQNLHLFSPFPAMPGVNALDHINVKSIALQVPTPLLRKSSTKVTPDNPRAVIGVWTSASRQQVKVRDHDDHKKDSTHGPFVQVSRLGNPLVNEVIIPLGRKDEWNSAQPADDKQFQVYVLHPEVATLLPPLYPGVFPNLAALVASGKPRADLDAILMTGIPSGLIPGFQNFTGPVEADMLRLNTAIPPSAKPNNLGLLGGDLAGFPNGRRPKDDVVTIELRAIAGVTFPLVDPTFTPDAAANAVSDFTDDLGVASVSSPFLNAFPYLGVPYDGYHNPSV